MPSPSLDELLRGVKLRCDCGETIQTRTWNDNSTGSLVLDLQVHARVLRREFSRDLYDVMRYDPNGDGFYYAVREMERHLCDECRKNPPYPVIDWASAAAQFPIQNSYSGAAYRKPQPAPKQVSTPKKTTPICVPFGKPIPRKLIS